MGYVALYNLVLTSGMLCVDTFGGEVGFLVTLMLFCCLSGIFTFF